MSPEDYSDTMIWHNDLTKLLLPFSIIKLGLSLPKCQYHIPYRCFVSLVRSPHPRKPLISLFPLKFLSNFWFLSISNTHTIDENRLHSSDSWVEGADKSHRQNGSYVRKAGDCFKGNCWSIKNYTHVQGHLKSESQRCKNSSGQAKPVDKQNMKYALRILIARVIQGQH